MDPIGRAGEWYLKISHSPDNVATGIDFCNTTDTCMPLDVLPSQSIKGIQRVSRALPHSTRPDSIKFESRSTQLMDAAEVRDSVLPSRSQQTVEVNGSANVQLNEAVKLLNASFREHHIQQVAVIEDGRLVIKFL